MTLAEFLPFYKSPTRIKYFHLTSGKTIPVGEKDKIVFQETSALRLDRESGTGTMFSLSSIESIAFETHGSA